MSDQCWPTIYAFSLTCPNIVLTFRVGWETACAVIHPVIDQ